MEIIIHGKPLDSSERYTPGVNQELARKIIKDFFAFGQQVKEPEAMVVEARNWQGIWVSVYTYFLSQKVKDTAGRISYFAISLVLPQKYCTMVSDVYYLLEKVIKENVLGVYLNSNLQYIVSNFENVAAFEGICSNLNSAYKNFEKAYDDSFRPQGQFTNDLYCSIYDCDSLAFLELLQSKGRVIITEKEDRKDYLAALSSKYYKEAEAAKSEVQSKSSKITDLERQVKQYKDAAEKVHSNESRKLSGLQQQITSLTNENEQLKQKSAAAQKQYEDLQGRVAQAKASVDQAMASFGVLKSVPKYGVKKEKETKKSLSSYTDNYHIPMILLILMAFVLFLFFLFNGCSRDNLTANSEEVIEQSKSDAKNLEDEILNLKDEILNLKDEISKKDEEISALNSVVVSCKDELEKKDKTINKLREDLQKQNQQTQKGTVSNPKKKKETETKPNGSETV